MPRKPRFHVPGAPVHAVQRGHNRSAVFFADLDYLEYLRCLKQAADSCGGPIRIDDKKAKELREKTEKHLSELLTKAQEEKWKAMLGPKFEKKKG